jgi:putative aminopeptidase FrvX
VCPAVLAADPDAVISLDITPACDTPDLRGLYPIDLGRGPAIVLMDFHGRGTLGGIMSAPALRRLIERVARQEKIPLQREVLVGVICDSAFIPVLGSRGYPTAALSIPQRYTHSAVTSCSMSDVRSMIALLEAVIGRFDKSVKLQRGDS